MAPADLLTALPEAERALLLSRPVVVEPAPDVGDALEQRHLRAVGRAARLVGHLPRHGLVPGDGIDALDGDEGACADDVVVFLDADCASPLRDLHRLLEAMAPEQTQSRVEQRNPLLQSVASCDSELLHLPVAREAVVPPREQ